MIAETETQIHSTTETAEKSQIDISHESGAKWRIEKGKEEEKRERLKSPRKREMEERERVTMRQEQNPGLLSHWARADSAGFRMLSSALRELERREKIVGRSEAERAIVAARRTRFYARGFIKQGKKQRTMQAHTTETSERDTRRGRRKCKHGTIEIYIWECQM